MLVFYSVLFCLILFLVFTLPFLCTCKMDNCLSGQQSTKNRKQVPQWRTGGEAGSLMAACELDVEVGDQSMDVVVPLHLQAEGRGEGQILDLHRIDVHLLKHTHVKNMFVCTFLIRVSKRWIIPPPWWGRNWRRAVWGPQRPPAAPWWPPPWCRTCQSHTRSPTLTEQGRKRSLTGHHREKTHTSSVPEECTPTHTHSGFYNPCTDGPR